MSDHIERDDVSGITTTGHEWDGIKELDNPAPRWWLIVFFLCCLWSVGYWVVYPAWPTLSGNTAGMAGWTQFNKLTEEQAEITALRAKTSERMSKKTLIEIQNDPESYAFAIAGGRTQFRENCAGCHGTGAQGGKGFPNLNDDDWLWGGDIESIYTTIKYGIRSGHDKARDSQMPSFRDMLKRDEINAVAEYVHNLSEPSTPPTDAQTLSTGKAIFAQNCVACHGEDAKGGRETGAPNLADKIALYANDKSSIADQMLNPKHGVMPAWEGRLSDQTIRMLAIYVHALGGGENAKK